MHACLTGCRPVCRSVCMPMPLHMSKSPHMHLHLHLSIYVLACPHGSVSDGLAYPLVHDCMHMLINALIGIPSSDCLYMSACPGDYARWCGVVSLNVGRLIHMRVRYVCRASDMARFISVSTARYPQLLSFSQPAWLYTTILVGVYAFLVGCMVASLYACMSVCM